MALCCCKMRKCVEPQDTESQKKEEPPTPHVTPESHELQSTAAKSASLPRPAGVGEQGTFRPRSASEPHKPGKKLQKPHLKVQTPSLRCIPEETSSNTLQSPLVGNLMYKTSLSCISGISDSSSAYHTPLSARRFVTTSPEHDDHLQPIQKDETEVMKRNTELVPPSLPKHSVPQERTYLTLITRMEKDEQANTELKEMISGLNKRLEELEKKQATPDGGRQLKNNASHDFVQFPQNCSVSTDVLVRLAKRMTQWRFLARRLHLQECDIQQIGVNFSNDIQEQSYQMLLKWKLSLSCNSDAYHTLGEAVREEFGETLYSDYVTMVQEAEGNSCQ